MNWNRVYKDDKIEKFVGEHDSDKYTVTLKYDSDEIEGMVESIVEGVLRTYIYTDKYMFYFWNGFSDSCRSYNKYIQLCNQVSGFNWFKFKNGIIGEDRAKEVALDLMHKACKYGCEHRTDV